MFWKRLSNTLLFRPTLLFLGFLLYSDLLRKKDQFELRMASPRTS